MIAGYVRISTLNQKDGVSIESQKSIISEYALRFELIKKKEDIVFYVDEGYSAKSLERPAMQQLIQDIKAAKITILFCYDLSRISRDLFDSNLFLNLMKKYNVIFKSLYEDAKIETAGDRFTTNIKILNNQYERERVIERTNDSLLSIAESGRYPCGGKVIFGYKRNENKDIAFHEKHCIIVKNIFRMASEGYLLDEITQYANEAQCERIFNNYQIKSLILNEKYTGVMTYKGKKYSNIIPRIIDLDLFEKAGNNFKTWKFKENQSYIFDGVVFCSVCGSKLTCTHSHGRSKKYYYYFCGKCNCSISQKSIEAFLSGINKTENKNTQKRIKKLLSRKETINNRIKRIREDYINEKYTDREFITLALPLEDELEKITVMLSSLEMTHDDFYYNLEISPSKKKMYVLANIRKILVNPMVKKIQEIEFI